MVEGTIRHSSFTNLEQITRPWTCRQTQHPCGTANHLVLSLLHCCYNDYTMRLCNGDNSSQPIRLLDTKCTSLKNWQSTCAKCAPYHLKWARSALHDIYGTWCVGLVA